MHVLNLSADYLKFVKKHILGKVIVRTIKVYAYHGCLPEESIIGSDYTVDVSLEADLLPASISDHLSDTVDYVHINAIVKEEMKIKSNLLEHVAKRIMDRILVELPAVQWVEVSVSKINPPISGDVEMVTIVLNSKRIGV